MEREDFRDWNGRGKERARRVEGRKRGLQNFFCTTSSSSSSFPFFGLRDFVCANDFHCIVYMRSILHVNYVYIVSGRADIIINIERFIFINFPEAKIL